MGRPAWLPPLNSHADYSINIGIHQFDSSECLPPSTQPRNLKSIHIFFYVDLKFFDFNNPNRCPIDGLALCHGISIQNFSPQPSQATVRNWVVRILQNRRVVPFRVDKVHCYRETDQLEPMLDESRDDQLHTEEDLACCMADFLIRAMNKYSQAGGEQLEISLLMEKLVTIPNQEFEAWMSWFQEQKRLNPNDFQNEYMAAIRVPRTLHELWYEASLRNCKSATDSCIESLEKLALEEECADSLGISCAICIEDLDQVEEVTKLPCLHLFHRECIVQWLKRSHFCPICRFNMPTS
ncbi:uncharacterized protein [Henckelia pumila]|uniref:uncharacterized protein n=1 Tax=Henckelia pumila TaxID=405737 RepID=UPI003C6DED81